MIIQGILAFLVLASLVVAYFSSKTWHWAHVLVVLGVFLSGVAFLFLASETLRINGVYRSQVNQLDKQLTGLQADTEALRMGTDNGGLINSLAADEVTVPEGAEKIPGIGDLDHQLHMEIRDRGRMSARREAGRH